MDRKELIDKVVRRIIEHKDREWAMNIHYWDWVPGVGMYGIYKAWSYTREHDYYRFIQGWVQEHLHEAYHVKTVNSTAPLLTVVSMIDNTGEKQYLKTCVDIGDWIIKEAPRTREGGLEHTVTEAGAVFSEQIWADTLFMVCIFLARLGKVTGVSAYTEEACRQLLIHHRLLKDKSTGLFYHGWNCENKNWMSGARWGRANAWITVSTVEMLDILPKDFKGRQDIIKSLSEQVSAYKKLQRENGMFGTLLDHPDSYDETSAAAGIAYGIKKGIKNGYLVNENNEIWQRAEAAVINQINENGEVEGVSTGTPVMPSLEAYKKIERYPTLYGQGLTLLMLCE